MPVIRKYQHLATPPIVNSAFLNIGIVNDTLFRFSCPVKRKHHAAILIRFKIIIYVAIGIIVMYNALVAPEIDRGCFQPGKVIAKISDHGVLYMPDMMMLDDLSFHISEKHSFV